MNDRCVRVAVERKNRAIHCRRRWRAKLSGIRRPGIRGGELPVFISPGHIPQVVKPANHEIHRAGYSLRLNDDLVATWGIVWQRRFLVSKEAGIQRAVELRHLDAGFTVAKVAKLHLVTRIPLDTPQRRSTHKIKIVCQVLAAIEHRIHRAGDGGDRLAVRFNFPFRCRGSLRQGLNCAAVRALPGLKVRHPTSDGRNRLALAGDSVALLRHFRIQLGDSTGGSVGGSLCAPRGGDLPAVEISCIPDGAKRRVLVHLQEWAHISAREVSRDRPAVFFLRPGLSGRNATR